MSRKTPSRPVWWKNSFFIFGVLLLIVALWGLVQGQEAIRDPGQKRENGLVLMYFGGAVLMVVNGYLTHLQAVQAYEEDGGEMSPTPVKEEA
ncbi:MAG: hypothetical protein KF812_04520 [Fimbriimonadaceae bacterium]|nr:hypothetical protein [Fimbriimonadaceae bacterium]